jgi:hypothetical protein
LLYSDGAEPFIGRFDDQSGFNFSEEFSNIMNLPMVEMRDKFRELTQSQEIDPAEFDDITTVGFEIM